MEYKVVNYKLISKEMLKFTKVYTKNKRKVSNHHILFIKLVEVILDYILLFHILFKIFYYINLV